jgi:hypothetical protein
MTFINAITRMIKSLRRSDAGSACVELAVIFPLVALLALGVSDFGRMYYAAITVAGAARAGAQYGAQNVLTTMDTASINQAARNEAADIGTIAATSSRFCRCPDGSTPSCTGTCPSYGDPEVFVRVSARQTVSFLMHYPGMPSSISISRTATFRVQ